jgi:hypothetical protein
MRCDIPPSVQFIQVHETSRIPWIGSREIHRESEALEVLLQILEVGIAMIDFRFVAGLARVIERDDHLDVHGNHILLGLYQPRTLDPLSRNTHG